MTTDNIIVEHLRGIRSILDQNTIDLREIKGRLGIMEPQIGTPDDRYVSLSNRPDRLDERVGRIEKDRNLADA
jgi:hypothetical protein